MTTTLRLLALLLSISLVSACSDSTGESAPGSLALAHQERGSAAALHYFTTSALGTHSVLWRADTTEPPSASGTLRRSRVTVVEHAPGYSPRGAISESGRLGWLTLPGDRRHGNPGQVWLDGALVDDRALYLQTPVFIGDDFFYLRREPGPERVGNDGRLLQTMDDFELVRIDSSGAEHIVHSGTALWFHFVGRLPGSPERLLVQRVRDDGAHLLVFEPQGRLMATHFLGTGAVRDIRVDPNRPNRLTYLENQGGPEGARVVEMNLQGRPDTASGRVPRAVLRDKLPPHASPLPLRSGTLLLATGDPVTDSFRVPLLEVVEGRVVWREHNNNKLTYSLLGPKNRRLRLVPPDDAAQDVSLLRGPR